MQKIIDPHLHFFDKKNGDYHWLAEDNPPFWSDKSVINKNIGPQSLCLNESYLLTGAVHIEAGFDNNSPNRELAFLESNIYPSAQQMQFRTIGLIDIFANNVIFKKELLKLSKFSSFGGVRVVFDENTGILENVNILSKNLNCLQNAELIFEFQADFTNTSLVNSLFEVLAILPNLTVVINHAGLAPLSHELNQTQWQTNIQRFADLPMCYVKCSGFEMTNRAYTKDQVKGVLKAVHQMFGSNRMMLASNFPLTLFSCSYQQYWDLVLTCLEDLNLPKEKILYTNAKDLYHFT
jgi:predicted TIM-barrel fold metal-dependent hydrolase